MKIGLQPLLERWAQQSAMFKQFADECADDELPPEMMERREHYIDMAARLRLCVKELKTILE